MGSCAGSEITINYHGSGMVKELPSIDVGMYGLYQATLRITDTRPHESVKVVAIDCGAGHCNSASFIFEGCDFSDIKCDEYAGCGNGCTVTQHGNTVPCDSVSTT
eukprot:256196_1